MQVILLCTSIHTCMYLHLRTCLTTPSELESEEEDEAPTPLPPGAARSPEVDVVPASAVEIGDSIYVLGQLRTVVHAIPEQLMSESVRLAQEYAITVLQRKLVHVQSAMRRTDSRPAATSMQPTILDAFRNAGPHP